MLLKNTYIWVSVVLHMLNEEYCLDRLVDIMNGYSSNIYG